jgi:hypothetical protein
MFDDVYESKILNHDMFHHNMDMLMSKELSMMLIISIHLFFILKNKETLLIKRIIKTYHYQYNLSYRHFLIDLLI